MADKLFALLAVAAEHAGEHGGGHAPGPLALGIAPPVAIVAAAMTVLILLALYLGVPKLLGSMLDKKITGIKHMLDEASSLRKEAEALKSEYEAKIAGAEKLAAEFKTAAEHEAQMIIDKAQADATALVARREKMAEDKIAAAERTAIAELRAKTAEAASAAARRLIKDNHNAQADRVLVDQAISGI